MSWCIMGDVLMYQRWCSMYHGCCCGGCIMGNVMMCQMGCSDASGEMFWCMRSDVLLYQGYVLIYHERCSDVSRVMFWCVRVDVLMSQERCSVVSGVMFWCIRTFIGDVKMLGWLPVCTVLPVNVWSSLYRGWQWFMPQDLAQENEIRSPVSVPSC